jgi:type II secretory pathway pseudopilin PulG
MAPDPGRRSVPREGGDDRSLTWPRVSVASAVLLVLAFVVPYSAVQALHTKRLRAADESTRAIAERLLTTVTGRPSAIPAGTEVLAGPGDRPVVNDERWNSATSIPLARLLPGLSDGDPAAQPDPWGNAYLVNVAARSSGGTVWVLSAGPDGIVQTPFVSHGAPLADDRAAQVR